MKTQLYTFGISHYCEKARWALDWHAVPYEEIGWPPGLHMRLARRLGAPRSSLPILRRGGDVVQGSSAIIDWAEAQSPDPSRSLAPTTDAETATEIEQRADAVIGVHVRRFVYAHVLPTEGHRARPYLLMNTSPAHRLIGLVTWPTVRRLMMRGMDASGPEAAADSQAKLEPELEALDARLADGRRYLVGDTFSRADLTVASLLAPLARPDEMPVYRDFELPAPVRQQLDAWHERPALRWVRDVYREHRSSVPTGSHRAA